MTDTAFLLTDDRLDDFRRQTDPPADEVIAKLVAEQGPEATRTLFDLLINRIELPRDQLPATLNTFIDTQKVLPEWAEDTLIRRSEALFLDHGPKFLLLLYFKSLPILYSCANGAQVLVKTGRLQHHLSQTDQFSRRIAETGQFLIEVMAPGAIAPGGRGIETVLRIRLIHAAIRHFIRERDWDPARGHPINQEDMAITLLTFSISVLDGLRQFKVETSSENEAAYLHHWKVIGHLLGIDPALLPEDTAAGRRLLAQILKRQAAPSEAGRLLGAALVDFARKAFKRSIVHRAATGFVRYLNDDAIRKAIGFDRGGGPVPWIVPRMARQWFRLIELIERINKPFAIYLDYFSRSIVRRMVAYFDEFKQRPLHISPTLTQSWGIEPTRG